MTDAALAELTTWCEQNGVEVVDFRDVDKYGHPANKERAEPKGTRGWASKELGYHLGLVVGSGKTIDEWRS